MGIRQTLALVDARGHVVKPRRTPFGQFLVRNYLSGGLKALALRQGLHAAGASSSGDLSCLRTDADARQRVRRGKLKQDSRNSAAKVKRNLLRGKPVEPYVALIPMWDERANSQVMEHINVLPIHETLDAIVGVGDEHSWSSIDEAQTGFQHELENWATRVVADVSSGNWFMLALWGDSGPYSKRDQVYLLTYRVLSGVHRTRLWIAAIAKRRICQCGCFGRCTFDALFEIVAWSMRALLVGKWPKTDHQGRPLRGAYRRRMAGSAFRFRAAVIAKCGDWAWHKQILGMRGWTGISRCWGCAARFDDTDFTLQAEWRNTCVSMAGFITSVLFGEQYVSKIFTVPGFSNSYIIPDWMHVCCLGILQYLSGNVMWELFVTVGGTLKINKGALSSLLNMAKAAATDLGVELPLNTLTMGMIRSGSNKKPKMRLKAAEGRYFLPILVRMLQLFFPSKNSHEEMRLHCCQALVRCYLELKRWVDDKSPSNLERNARQHLVLYAELGRSMSVGSLFWNLYPKHHLFVHVSNTRANPAALWNYCDEDEMGACARACGTLNPLYIHRQAVQWYRASWPPQEYN